MTTSLERPQIICHQEARAGFNLFDGKWIPCSAKFAVVGSRANNNGVIQVYELSRGEVHLLKETEKDMGFKCCTFGASPLRDRFLATGDFSGFLHIWNLEDTTHPIYSVKAHTQMCNCIDGVGGQRVGTGAPEIVTGGREGTVKVWDPRQKGKPVAVMEPMEGHDGRDCWCVAFGNSYNNEERAVVAGYDNGDIKMFDLRKTKVIWETNVKNGVCGLDFDRKDIEMNKLVATTLESKFCVFDLRTLHPEKGFACVTEKAHNSTVWTAKHLPQNRDVFMTGGGNGTIYLWQYKYPLYRRREDASGDKIGVPGTIELIQNQTLSSQPVGAWDWSPDKAGLGLSITYDEVFRIVVVTKLNLL